MYNRLQYWKVKGSFWQKSNGLSFSFFEGWSVGVWDTFRTPNSTTQQQPRAQSPALPSQKSVSLCCWHCNLLDSFVGGLRWKTGGLKPLLKKESRKAHDGDMKMKDTCTQTQNTHTCILHAKQFINLMIIWSLYYHHPSLCLGQWDFAFELKIERFLVSSSSFTHAGKHTLMEMLHYMGYHSRAVDLRKKGWF